MRFEMCCIDHQHVIGIAASYIKRAEVLSVTLGSGIFRNGGKQSNGGHGGIRTLEGP